MIISTVLAEARTSPLLHERGRWLTGGELMAAGLIMAERLAGSPALVCRGTSTAAVLAAAVAAETLGVAVTFVDPRMGLSTVGIVAEDDGRDVVTERIAPDSPLRTPLGRTGYGFLSSGSTATPTRVIRGPAVVRIDGKQIARAVYSGRRGVALAAPSFYLYGFSHLVAALTSGLVVRAVRTSATTSSLAAAASADVQIFVGLPFQLDLVLDTGGGSAFAALEAVVSSAGRLGPETIERSLAAGLPLYNAYGSTETGTLSVGEVGAVANPVGYVGRPLAGVEARVTTSPNSDLSTLQVRTGGLADGVVRERRYTGILAADRWYSTSDVVRCDESGIWLIGRQTDFLKVAGTRVSCLRIRSVILRHPGVVDAEVFGVDDRMRGEVPACRVVLRPDTSVDDLQAWWRDVLTTDEVPRVVDHVDRIPRSATGKVVCAR